MDAGRHFIEHWAVFGGEEFQRDDAHIFERFGHLFCKLSRLFDLSLYHRACWQDGAGQNAVLMFVASAIPKANLAILSAHSDNRELCCKFHHALIDQRLLRQHESLCIALARYAPLALAIIAIAAGLEDAGGANRLYCSGKVSAGFDIAIRRTNAA